MRKQAVWLASFALCAVAAMPAHAQVQFGPQLTYGLDVEEIAIGGRVEIGLPNKLSQTGPLASARFVGSLDYYLVDCGGADSCSLIEINPGLVVPLQSATLKPYVGGGLNLARSSVSIGGTSNSNTETGINLIGGLNFGLSGMAAFTEARLSLGGSEQLALTFGILFGGGN